MARQKRAGHRLKRLETVDLRLGLASGQHQLQHESYLDSLCIEFEAVFGDQELLNILTLITLELNHLAHLTVGDDGAIAGELLLDDLKHVSVFGMCHFVVRPTHLEDLLLVKLLREALDSRQSLTTIAL
jgi:hypothetical protein